MPSNRFGRDGYKKERKKKEKKKRQIPRPCEMEKQNFRGGWLARRAHICNPDCTCTGLNLCAHTRIYFAAFTTRHPRQVASRDEIMRRTANVRGKLTRALNRAKDGVPFSLPLGRSSLQTCWKDRSLAQAVSCFTRRIYPEYILRPTQKHSVCV